MKLVKSLSLVPCLVVALSATALAQTSTGVQREPGEGIIVSAFTGASFGPLTAATFAGEFADRIHPNVHAYATLSYHENLMDKDVQNEIAALNSFLTSVTGANWQLSGRDRGVAFIAGAKYLAGRTVRPYIGGGAGAINIRRRITEPVVGDVTEAALREFNIGNLSLTTSSLVRPIVEATAGVGFHGRRTYFDVGYRYRRAFQVDSIDYSQFLAGVGVIF